MNFYQPTLLEIRGLNASVLRGISGSEWWTIAPTSCPTTTPSEYGTRTTRDHVSSYPSLCPHVITQGTCFFPSDFLEGALTLESSLPCFHPMMWLSITQLCKQPSEESQSPWHYKTLLLWPLWTNALLFKGNFNLSAEKKNLMHWVFENSYILTYPCDGWEHLV